MTHSTEKTGPTFVATRRTAMLGAMFLMAVSAVGPGFITQTSEFTMQFGAAFACAILISVIVDIAIQMNVWRTLGVSGLYAQELGNRIVPGLGWALAALIFFGGIVFNVGNIAGAGLGMNAMVGVNAELGGVISVVIALAIFLSKKAGVALDRIVILCGAVLILLMGYMAVTTNPPVGQALTETVAPVLPEGENINTFFFAVTTLIGGTVGGYITYAGAHRPIASGHTGPETPGRSPGPRSWGSSWPVSSAICCSWLSWARSPPTAPCSPPTMTTSPPPRSSLCWANGGCACSG